MSANWGKWLWWRGKERTVAETLLVAMQNGAILKAHRTMDGAKVHKLHSPKTEPTQIDADIVRYLEKHNLVQSNMKFPAASYLLTAQGIALAQRVGQSTTQPLTVRIPQK